MKTRYRVTVDWGDDRIRVYAVTASSPQEAEQSVLDGSLLAICASENWNDHDDDDWIDGEWEVGARYAPIGNPGRPE